MKRIFFSVLMLPWITLVSAQHVKIDSTKYPTLVTYTTQQDHENMMKQLGIVSVRPGANYNEKVPDHANYDESAANPCPQLPDVLTLKNGKKVTSADMWWKQRRPELVEDIERELYGKVPAKVPNVTWIEEIVDKEMVGRIPVMAKQLIGHVDNSEYPLIDVNIKMVLVVPVNVKGPVPVLMMFGRSALPAPAQPSPDDLLKINNSLKEMLIRSDPDMRAMFEKYPAYSPIARLPGPNMFAPAPDGNSPPTEQLLVAGWGYATIEPASIQADHGAGLTRGIIGLVNKGQPRKPDDWGALRAWAWGASRALDYLETQPAVDSKKIGIEGVSRYGKAALVAHVFDTRFAVGLIASSGKGGAGLYRRTFGEAVENLTARGEYHWMAGNYIKYGASKASFGSKTGCDLPVDSHEVIALAAPRPTFISYGIPEKGDVKWTDQTGSFMASVGAGPVFKLLGAKDLGVSNDYANEKMPPVLTGMLEGELAWRQHDGGHTDAPNFQFFIPWANKMLKYTRAPLQ